MAEDKTPRGAGADELVVIGTVGKPKGVRGWMRCRSFTGRPSDLADLYREWILRDGAGRVSRWRVEKWTAGSEANVLEVKLEGCDDRDLAASLTNRQILIGREEFPALEEEGSYYWVDLLGFTVRDVLTGADLGVMTGVMEQPGGDLIEVETPLPVEEAAPSPGEDAGSDAGSEDAESSDAASRGAGSSPETGSVSGPSPKGRSVKSGKALKKIKKPKPKKTLVPWVWGVYVLGVDMDERVITVEWPGFD